MSAVSKAFRILEIVTAAGGGGLPFARIVEETGIPKASAHRLLGELVELSALSLDPTTRRYRGGLMLARLGAAVTARFPPMFTIADRLGRSSSSTFGTTDGRTDAVEHRSTSLLAPPKYFVVEAFIRLGLPVATMRSEARI